MGIEDQDGSFRDPAGYVFKYKGEVFRQINQAGKDDYEAFISTGLYESLKSQNLIVPHEEITAPSGLAASRERYKLLRPKQLPFISYPYEWSFSQLKDAALLTLKIQDIALDHGMILKDASAYNIQYLDGSPILIDTLSFERYEGGSAWKAYRQFCQHFLAPLALMSKVDVRLNSLLRDYIDGIPLDLAAKLLPAAARLRPGLLTHIWIHSAAQKRYANRSSKQAAAPVASAARALTTLKAQADSMRRTVSGFRLHTPKTEWGEYYTFTNYERSALEAKAGLVKQYVGRIGKPEVWDLGGNDGRFSRAAIEAGATRAVCYDIDPIAVEKCYLKTKHDKETALLPLLFDLTNPSPAIGWANRERSSFTDRAVPETTVMALALIHHIAISNNVPLDSVAAFFARLGSWLIIEFVPKDDSKVQILLSTREDIFPLYTKSGFEAAFGRFFTIEQRDNVPGSKRIMYLMKRKQT